MQLFIDEHSHGENNLIRQNLTTTTKTLKVAILYGAYHVLDLTDRIADDFELGPGTNMYTLAHTY